MVPERLAHVVTAQWGHDLIGSWNTHAWMELPARVGARIAPLLGVQGDDVHVGDSTTVALYKAMVAGVRARPHGTALVLERGAFPTDRYVAAAVARVHGLELREVDPQALPDDPALLAGAAVVCLTQVDFRTGVLLDVAALTRVVHEAGALVLWDLSHSVGAVPVGLVDADADLAVGCGYKYLNGAPAPRRGRGCTPGSRPTSTNPCPAGSATRTPSP